MHLARVVRTSLGIGAVALSLGCPHRDKAQVCDDVAQTMMRAHEIPSPGSAAHAREFATIARDTAKVLEGVRGVPQADAHRRDLETLAERMDEMADALAGRVVVPDTFSFGDTYYEATKAVKRSSREFTRWCSGH